MTDATESALIRRLDRLECEARRWRLATLIVGALLGLVGLVGAATPASIADEVRARRFTLVDDAGRERARLAMTFKTNSGEREPELWIGNDNRDGSGTYVYSYGLSTREKSGNGFVNLNPLGLRMVLGEVEIEINSGLGVGGPRLGLSGPSS